MVITDESVYLIITAVDRHKRVDEHEWEANTIGSRSEKYNHRLANCVW